MPAANALATRLRYRYLLLERISSASWRWRPGTQISPAVATQTGKRALTPFPNMYTLPGAVCGPSSRM